ncbi:DUF397 domain-containing protein [Streptomyces xantholiticus]
MRPLGAAAWRKSSYSGDTGGQCVEVADLAPHVAVRDSKNPDGPALTAHPRRLRGVRRRGGRRPALTTRPADLRASARTIGTFVLCPGDRGRDTGACDDRGKRRACRSGHFGGSG